MRIWAIVEARVNEQIQEAINKHDASQSKVKKWRNSWRSASPITKGSFILTAAIALATIAYALTAWRTLGAMRQISSDSSTQTQKLIDAAQQMKDAAWQFKGSAEGIDGNLGNAVAKLQGQVDQMKAQTSATEDAFYWEQRPWVAVQLPEVSPSAVGVRSSSLSSALVRPIVHNTGRTPALKWRVECQQFATRPSQEKVPDCDEIRRANTEEEINEDAREILKTQPTVTPDEARHRATSFIEQAEAERETPGAEGKTLVPDEIQELGFSGEIAPEDSNYHYLVGRIVYGDAIRPSVEHSTNFCLERFGGSHHWHLCDFGQTMN